MLGGRWFVLPRLEVILTIVCIQQRLDQCIVSLVFATVPRKKIEEIGQCMVRWQKHRVTYPWTMDDAPRSRCNIVASMILTYKLTQPWALENDLSSRHNAKTIPKVCYGYPLPSLTSLLTPNKDIDFSSNFSKILYLLIYLRKYQKPIENLLKGCTTRIFFVTLPSI